MSALQSKVKDLLDARLQLQIAEDAVILMRESYGLAEEALLKEMDAAREGDAMPQEMPRTIVVQRLNAPPLVIVPAEEWYDCPPGKRLEIHTTLVLEVHP